MASLRWFCLIALVAWSPGMLAHPHDEDAIVVLTGTLTKVDLRTRTIEIDVYDRQANQTRNLLLFVDPKMKLIQGKRNIAPAELVSGQQVTVTAEREALRGNRLVAFEIRVREPPK